MKICAACGNERPKEDPDYCPICKDYRYIEEISLGESEDDITHYKGFRDREVK